MVGTAQPQLASPVFTNIRTFTNSPHFPAVVYSPFCFEVSSLSPPLILVSHSVNNVKHQQSGALQLCN